MNIFKTKDDIELSCEYDYEKATDIIRKEKTNGCGPGGWKFDIVPDTIYFLSIRDACDIHDWMYLFGETIEDKKRADRSFLNNMIRLIDARGGKSWFSRKILKRLRYRRAKTYYAAVNLVGGPAFWKGKNKVLKAIKKIIRKKK